LPVGSIVGGMASILRLKASYGSSFKPAANNSILAFLSHAHKERIIEQWPYNKANASDAKSGAADQRPLATIKRSNQKEAV